MSKEIPELNPVHTIKRGPYAISISREAYHEQLWRQLVDTAREMYEIPAWVQPRTFSQSDHTWVGVFEWYELVLTGYEKYTPFDWTPPVTGNRIL